MGEELWHHGIKGMQWGVRRTPEQLGHKVVGKNEEIDDDYSRAHSKKSVKQMSDAELAARLRRLNMEQQYAKLNPSKLQKGVAFIKKGVNFVNNELPNITKAYKTIRDFMDDAEKSDLSPDWLKKSISKTKDSVNKSTESKNKTAVEPKTNTKTESDDLAARKASILEKYQQRQAKETKKADDAMKKAAEKMESEIKRATKAEAKDKKTTERLSKMWQELDKKEKNKKPKI